MPATTEAKLSSVRTRSAASRATSVPPRPMATPRSARRKAGASLTPSPVMATTCPPARRASTISHLLRRLHPGEHARASNPLRSFAPRRGRELRARDDLALQASAIPSSRAMANAVAAWSPVIILTATPARRQAATADPASGRSGSMKPTRPSSVRPSSSARSSSGLAEPRSSTRFVATASTR